MARNDAVRRAPEIDGGSDETGDPVLDWSMYGNSMTAWLTALAIAGGAFAGLEIGKTLVVRHLRALARRTSNVLDDIAAAVLGKTRAPVLLVVSLYAGAQAVVLPERLAGAIDTATIIAVLAQVAIWGNVALDSLLRRHARRRMEAEDAASATTTKFAGFVLRFALWVAILLVGLDNLGVDITALVAGLGVGGIAVALAVQNILGDLFASLSIVLDQPFVIGDFIVVDDLMGTVEHVGMKTTRVRSLSGEQIVLANNDLLGSRIRNFKRMSERRIVFTVGVEYGTPHAKLAAIPEIVRETVEAQDRARFDRAHFRRFGDFSLDYEIVYYVLDPDYELFMDVQQAVNLELYRRFEEEGIEFAFPTQTLHVRGAAA